MTGELTILGLSPYNDYHLFDIINDSNIDKCIYYYFDDTECDRIEKIIPKLKKEDRLKFKSVKAFWEDI